MIYKLNEYVYEKQNKYTFKQQLFLNNNNRLVYCFVAVKGGKVECLLQSLYSGFSKSEKDKAIKDYLSGKKEQNNKDYSNLNNNAKPLIKLVSCKIG